MANVKYSNFHIYIQKMEALFDRCRENASDLLVPGCMGVFGAELDLTSSMKTAVFKYAEQHSVAVKSTLEFIMHEALLVTWRQLNDFLSNRKYGSALPAHTEAPSSTTAP